MRLAQAAMIVPKAPNLIDLGARALVAVIDLAVVLVTGKPLRR